MSISGMTVDRLAILPSSYHVSRVRVRSPTVYFKPCCFNRINAVRSVSALHSGDHTIEPPISPLQLKSQNNKEENPEEIIYCFIAQKFAENGISMTPSEQVDSWPDHQEQKLRAIHASEAMDMIDSHLSFVTERFVGRQSSKLKLGKLYAANVKYGYYLKRVHEMFEKERSDIEPDSFWDVESTILYADEGDDMTNRLRSYVMQLDAEMLKKYATI